MSSNYVIAANPRVNNNTIDNNKADDINYQFQSLKFRQFNQLFSSIIANNQTIYKKPKPQTKKPKIDKIKFDFDNSYDYGACLDSILLAYEKRIMELENTPKNQCANDVFSLFGNQLSKDITLQLIEAANFHATQVLEDKLYPSLGLRRRVAINLGYVYEIDRQNEDILKYIKTENK